MVVDALLTPLAVARVTRLITSDMITNPLRIWLVGYFGTDSKVSYLIMCDWCSSIYVGAVAGAAWWAWSGSSVFTGIVLALSGSYAAGFLNSKVDD